MRDKANTYTESKDSEKRESDLKKALKLSKQINHSVLTNAVTSQLVNLYIDEGKYIEAKTLLMPILEQITEIGKSAAYSMCAKIYYGIGIVDSAEYYSKLLLKDGTLHTQESSCKRLAEIAIKKDMPQQALEYLRLNSYINDSLKQLQAKETITKANAAYNYQQHVKESHELRLKNIAARNHLIILLLIVACLLLSIMFLVSRYRRNEREMKIKMYNLEKANRRQLQLSEEKMRNNTLEIADIEKRLLQIDNLDNGQVFELREKKNAIILWNRKSEFEIRQHKNKYEVLRNTRIYEDITTMMNNPEMKKIINEEQWKQIDATINDIFVDFSKRLFSFCKFSETEYRISMLIKIGVSPINISRIMCLSPQAVSSVRSRLYQKSFGKKGSPSEWDEFVKSL